MFTVQVMVRTGVKMRVMDKVGGGVALPYHSFPTMSVTPSTRFKNEAVVRFGLGLRLLLGELSGLRN